MTMKMAQAPPALPPAATYALPELPTFPLEVGWREVYDPDTQSYQQLPLSLLDILYPADEDVGVVVMPESPLHDLWTRLLAVMLQNYLAAPDWLIISDVIIHWGRRGAPAKAPDLAAIPAGHLPEPENKSYRVGRDGPLPAFVIEITSEDTRQVDLQEKPLLYAAVGVREMLIIDLLSTRSRSRQLIGYRLEDRPYYRRLKPDDEGGLTFESIGLRFVAVGRERVEVYEAATGARLLTPGELKARVEAETARAEAEAARAEAEAAGRAAAEARVAELAFRLRELETRYGLPASDQPTAEPEPDND